MRGREVLGAYVAGDTLAHRLDARVKIVLLILATVAVFAADAPWGLLLAAAGLVAALVASRTSPTLVVRGLRPAALILAFSVLANAVVLVGQPGLSLDGLSRSALAVARIALLVGFALTLSSTTMPTEVATALSWLMAPLSRVGVPVGGISTATSIALRFIPITATELERIRAAQRARGARQDGGALEVLAGWRRVLVPLVVALFRRADDLAEAMADRCYTGEQTSMARPLRPVDWVALALGLAWVLAAALL
ncbi:energy-coupling factor transporter transmembrane component T [Olsenella sp. An293]|uniref:energy-coupling factor transporter transmembrane component T family protein n=1 Tax=Olsenella sp. An293 TaxID=1965626 RepID=UPI000B37361E|nr:energy-coupling factor transporter transmembrane component T [Olsenella sp. An293]OUO33128.1 hypothetical protein B5F85_03540 [Olsenella sp. An293]